MSLPVYTDQYDFIHTTAAPSPIFFKIVLCERLHFENYFEYILNIGKRGKKVLENCANIIYMCVHTI